MYNFRLAWRSPLAARAQVQLWSRPVHARMFTCSSVRGDENKQEKIIRLLREKFEPSDLQVQDVSGTYTVAYARWLRFFLCHHDQIQGLC